MMCSLLSSPATATNSRPYGVVFDGSTQRHAAGAAGEAEGEEGGRAILAELQRGPGGRGQETEGQPAEQRQTHRGEVQISVGGLQHHYIVGQNRSVCLLA